MEFVHPQYGSLGANFLSTNGSTFPHMECPPVHLWQSWLHVFICRVVIFGACGEGPGTEKLFSAKEFVGFLQLSY